MPLPVSNPKSYAQLAKERDDIDAAIRALRSGAKAAMVSTAGASQSYTQRDLDELQLQRDRVNNQMLSLAGRERPLRSFYLNPT